MITADCKRQWCILESMVKADRLPQAFLFSGKSSCDKKEMALKLIKLLVGPSHLIDKGIYPDLKIVTPEGGEIEISRVRELKEFFSSKPIMGKYKFAIIDKAHFLNREAQSALLKILEEPNKGATFFLITDLPFMLLPTILSRVQEIKFYGPDNVSHSVKDFKEVSQLINSGIAERFNCAKELSYDRQAAMEALEGWMESFRSMLVSGNLPRDYSSAKLIRIIRKIQTAYFLLAKSKASPRLILENVLLEF